MSDSHFDVLHTAILDRAPREPIDPETGVHDTAETTRNEPTIMEFRTHSSGRGILVVSEVFYPGWTATVNAQPVPIYRADGVLRGVSVPNGDSIVRFEYRPWSVRLGFALTLAAILTTVVLGFFSRVSRDGVNCRTAM